MKVRHALSLLIAPVLLLGLGFAVFTQTVFAQEGEEITPNVRISPTGVIDGKVLIARAAVTGPSWVVIHADDNGKPGEVIGYTAVEEGENLNVAVEVDTEEVTPMLHAMLHDDKGEVGTFEFPGADTPTMIDDDIVMAAFSALPVPAVSEPLTPNVQVSAEGVVDGKVIITRAATSAPSWVAIHADDNGEPGDVIGYAPLNEGENQEVIVEVDTEAATPILHAMLHDDNGELGLFEFPGVDTPTELDGNIVMAAFSAAGTPEEPSTGTGGPVSEQGNETLVDSSAKGAAAPVSMPTTGGATPTGIILLVVVGFLAALAGGALFMRRGQILRP